MAKEIVSGIYKIENAVNGKCYIGSACILARRLSRHKTDLKMQVHCNPKLQHAWIKYGPQSFSFSVVELVEDKTHLIHREQYWIDAMDSVNTGYNIAPVAGSSLGIKKTAEAIEKTAAAHRGTKRSEETRHLIRMARAKQPPLSTESIAKGVAARKGQIVSAETRMKLSLANKGRKATPEEIEKNRLKQIGKVPSDSTKEKLRISSTGRKHSEESKAKMSVWQIGRKMPPESVAKAAANRVISDGGREKMAAAGRSMKGRSKPDGMAEKLRKHQIAKCWKPSEKMIEASRKAHIGKKVSAEVIAKRVATRAKNKALKEAFQK